MDMLNSNVSELCRHGGNLDAARKVFPLVKRWVDLSTGINPVAYPVPALMEEIWQCLPGEVAHDKLLNAAASYYGLPSSENLIAAPGTQALMQVLPRIVRASQVAIVSPTYNEHEKCWRQSGAEVCEISQLDDLPATTDVVVAVNPNNPDGAVFMPEELLELAKTLAGRGGLLIVDEAFCDGMPRLSVAQYSGVPGLLALRSFGKFFGLAGVRLGFAIGDKSLLRMITEELGPWAVSGPALEIGAAAYSDENWISENQNRLKADSVRLRTMLETAGISVAGGTDLFVLVAVKDAKELWTHLARQGIWSLLFDYSKSWVRFGLPGKEQDWQQLEIALAERPV